MGEIVIEKSENPENKLKYQRNMTMLGIYIAVFICILAGNINDVIMAKFLPAIFAIKSAEFGLAFTMASLGKLIMMVPYAKLSDKFGRKPLLLFAFIIYTAGTFLTGAAPTIELFLLFRILKGMSSFEGVVLALINDYYEKGTRGRPIAFIFTINGIASLIGTIIGGFFLKWFEFRFGFFVLGLFTFISIISVAVLVRNTTDRQILSKNNKNSNPQRNKLVLKQIIKQKNFMIGVLLGIILTFISSGVSSYSLYLLLNSFNIEPELSGIFLLPVNSAYIILSYVVGQRENIHKTVRIVVPLMAATFFCFIFLKWFDSIFIFIVLLIISSAFLGILQPSIDNFISELVPKEHKGEFLGIYKGAILLGSILGFRVIGYVGEAFWEYTPYLLLGGISLVAIMLCFQMKKTY